MIFAVVSHCHGHIWLGFYALRHPFIALGILGIATLLNYFARLFSEIKKEKEERKESDRSLAVYLEKRTEVKNPGASSGAF